LLTIAACACAAAPVRTSDYEFDYGYPAAAARIHALKAWLDKDAAAQRADLASQSREGRADAKQAGFPFNPYEATTKWQVVTDLPGWLSLSGAHFEYTGGAHPNHWPLSLVWDKTRNREVEAKDLFVSPAALSAAIHEPFCAALSREQAQRRGQPVDANVGGTFDDCPDLADVVVILGSDDHLHFTRIGLLMAPYVAGPYVEGDYEVTVPVTPAVLEAVRPQYRAAFAVGR
jgi:hypothetical protein